MEHVRNLPRAERIGNLIAKVLVRAGVGSSRMHLITVVGRRTGKPYTTPLTVVETDGQRWLVAPYAGVSWAKNARASGTAKLSRGRVWEQVTIEPVDAEDRVVGRDGLKLLQACIRPDFERSSSGSARSGRKP